MAYTAGDVVCQYLPFFGVTMIICLFVDGPTTAGTGVANCVMRYDGTDPHCGLQCNAPYVFPVITDCFA